MIVFLCSKVSVATAVVTVVGIVAVMIMGAVMTLGMGTEDPQGTHHLIVVVEIILLSCLMGEGQEGKDRILLMKGTMFVVADRRASGDPTDKGKLLVRIVLSLVRLDLV